MRKIVFVFLVTLFPNLVFACAKDKVDIYKYVTDSKIADAPILEGCLNINFLLAPKYVNEAMYLAGIMVNVKDSSGVLMASVPLAIVEEPGYQVANACLSESALKASELELVFLHKAHAELSGDGYSVLGGMACNHTEIVRLTSLVETLGFK
ncbi:hypothetical protein OQJ62_15870 [Microbulbifer thermotolerans]|uniref:hypothetical protein n=1 Tax=Microbulbifer thermotolerans TaxID=252514 RepID=UPI0022487A89|nr:hypothetical protein [Microbulbifer thermotolerans]MCX2796402.1 hypothetical protein [Microbulbifer thermotolerans]